MRTKQQIAAEFANSIVQSRTVASVPTIGNGDNVRRLAERQAGRVATIAAKAATCYSNQPDADDKATAEEMASLIVQGIFEAANAQVKVDEICKGLIGA